EELVAYRIPELDYDVNGNGTTGDLLASGAFDLTRGLSIDLTGGGVALGSARQEISGGLLAFSARFLVPGDGERDLLGLYDADLEDPSPFVLGTEFPVTRLGPAGETLDPSLPDDFAVRDGRVAFIVPSLAVSPTDVH